MANDNVIDLHAWLAAKAREDLRASALDDYRDLTPEEVRAAMKRRDHKRDVRAGIRVAFMKALIPTGQRPISQR
jgi:hypothetical protein